MMPFPPATKADWLARAEQELKGKDVNWTPAPGLTISPFAHAEDLPAPPPRPFVNETGGWTPGVSLRVQSDAALTNRELLQLLQNGAGAVQLIFEMLPDFDALFRNVQCAWVEWHFAIAGTNAKKLVNEFVQYLHRTEQPVAEVVLFAESAEAQFTETTHPPTLRNLMPLNLAFREDDTAIFVELQQYRTWMEALSVDDFERCFLPVYVSDNYLLSIAKLRALNVLYNQRRAALGLAGGRPPLVAHVGPTTFTDNEHINKIRATAQTMAAVVGGAQTVFVHGSDANEAGAGTPFNRRIALNVLHLLQMESHLERHPDPAAGSFYLEQLTQRLLDGRPDESRV